ncbi:hypothetical protein IWQ62_002324 [Dispira parvispora]|uniref:Uncharacterized protein n=1 Tax=Dispira parvispora TaxID=1520584 RepID=A0A9W8E2T4_9FUNG|nr:hypothetical protein IWQ62_002324 [Dispira parvispora]
MHDTKGSSGSGHTPTLSPKRQMLANGGGDSSRKHRLDDGAGNYRDSWSSSQVNSSYRSEGRDSHRSPVHSPTLGSSRRPSAQHDRNVKRSRVDDSRRRERDYDHRVADSDRYKPYTNHHTPLPHERRKPAADTTNQVRRGGEEEEEEGELTPESEEEGQVTSTPDGGNATHPKTPTMTITASPTVVPPSDLAPRVAKPPTSSRDPSEEGEWEEGEIHTSPQAAPNTQLPNQSSAPSPSTRTPSSPVRTQHTSATAGLRKGGIAVPQPVTPCSPSPHSTDKPINPAEDTLPAKENIHPIRQPESASALPCLPQSTTTPSVSTSSVSPPGATAVTTTSAPLSTPQPISETLTPEVPPSNDAPPSDQEKIEPRVEQSSSVTQIHSKPTMTSPPSPPPSLPLPTSTELPKVNRDLVRAEPPLRSTRVHKVVRAQPTTVLPEAADPPCLGYFVYEPGRLLPCFSGREDGVFHVRIPKMWLTWSNPQVQARSLWGHRIYTDDSDLVAVLIHLRHCSPPTAGTCPHDLVVTVKVVSPLRQYHSTTQHGLTSRSWQYHDGASWEVVQVVPAVGKASRGTQGRKQLKRRLREYAVVRCRTLGDKPVLFPGYRFDWLQRRAEEQRYPFLTTGASGNPAYVYNLHTLRLLETWVDQFATQFKWEPAKLTKALRPEHHYFGLLAHIVGGRTVCLENDDEQYLITSNPVDPSTDQEKASQVTVRAQPLQRNMTPPNSSETPSARFRSAEVLVIHPSLSFTELTWSDKGLSLPSILSPGALKRMPPIAKINHGNSQYTPRAIHVESSLSDDEPCRHWRFRVD